jgi:hypothetical protein
MILSVFVVVTSVTLVYISPPPRPTYSVVVSTVTVVTDFPSSLLEILDFPVDVFSGIGASIITGPTVVVITVSYLIISS